jgi:hypothetical protein
MLLPILSKKELVMVVVLLPDSDDESPQVGLVCSIPPCLPLRPPAPP